MIHQFLSTLSLRRATGAIGQLQCTHGDFYPRSPCGERLPLCRLSLQRSYFYPRSPCGERQTFGSARLASGAYFYPRSPCGERPCTTTITICTASFLSTLSLRRATHAYQLVLWVLRFLSTLSLRRATWGVRKAVGSLMDFYPRSPCGERLFLLRKITITIDISIHALLAESDA